MASWQNGKLMKWWVDKNASRQNDKLMKWWVDEMSSWQNGKLTKWQADKMERWWNGELKKWRAHNMTSWHKGMWRKWRVDNMASCLDYLPIKQLVRWTGNWWNSKLTGLLEEKDQAEKWQFDETASCQKVSLQNRKLMKTLANQFKIWWKDTLKKCQVDKTVI